MTTRKDKDNQTDSKPASQAVPPGDKTAEKIQREMDEATEQGFIGVEVDQTPNENYTVQGVTSGAPTPETDPDKDKR